MKLLQSNQVDYFHLFPNEYKQEMNINYELVELSNNKLSSIDRGSSTDRYFTTLTFKGNKAYIDSVYNVFQDLRINKKAVLLSECEERIFGEHINHENTISSVVYDMKETQSPVFNLFTLSVSLLADTSSLTFYSPGLLNLTCLSSGYKAYSNWGTYVNETYNQSIFFVDKKVDSYVFEGSYDLNNNQTSGLLSLWRDVRGSKLTINESQFGVVGMFGPSFTGTSHDIIIEKITYSRISPLRKKVTIKIIKQ